MKVMQKLGCTVALAGLLAAGSANAAILFENGIDGDFWGGNNPFTYQLVTDDFALGSNSTLSSLTYNAFTTSSTVPVTNVLVDIFANNGGSIGTLLYTGNFAVANQQVIGNDGYYYDFTDYTVNLPGWSLAAGDYFLGLLVSPQQWDQHWSIPNVTFGQTGSDGFDHYFRLEGTVSAVPEPETYAMLLIGLGLLGFSVSRRKQNA